VSSTGSGPARYHCSLCGLRFSEPAESECGRCALRPASCGLVRCPRCGFEIPNESRLVGWLRRKLGISA
jgi:hypothetical protein